jgi:hypothetical protein
MSQVRECVSACEKKMTSHYFANDDECAHGVGGKQPAHTWGFEEHAVLDITTSEGRMTSAWTRYGCEQRSVGETGLGVSAIHLWIWRAIERGEMTAMSRLGGVGRRRTAERNKPATHDESHEE